MRYQANGTFSDILSTVFPSSVRPLFLSMAVTADFNQDGIADILYSGASSFNESTRQIYYLWGSSSGAYSNAASHLASSVSALFFGNMVVADVDGVNGPDVVGVGSAYSLYGGPLQILINDGSGGLSNQISTYLPTMASVLCLGASIAVADFSGDGRPDIFYNGLYFSFSMSFPTLNTFLFFNNGSGEAFRNVTLTNLPFYFGLAMGAVVPADYDNDGDVDLLMFGKFYLDYSYDLSNSRYYLQNNNGVFVDASSKAAAIPGLSFPAGAAAKIAGDGNVYVYLLGTNVNSSSDGGLFMLGNSSSFQSQSSAFVAGEKRLSNPSVAFADFNGDSLVDLVVAGQILRVGVVVVGRVNVYVNEGGTLRDRSSRLLPSYPQSPIAATALAKDLDGDGCDELIVSGILRYNQVFKFVMLRGFCNGTLQQVNLPLVYEMAYAVVEAADFNLDGRLDVFVQGLVHLNYDSGLWLLLEQQASSLLFFDRSSNLPPPINSYNLYSTLGMAKAIDYNNDMYPDLLVCGKVGDFGISQALLNLKNMSFAYDDTVLPSSMPPLLFGAMIVDDFNSDNLLDVYATGVNQSVIVNFPIDPVDPYITFPFHIVLRNLGNGSFADASALSLPSGFDARYNTFISPADFNGDGKNEYLLTGMTKNYFYDITLLSIWTNGSFYRNAAAMPTVTAIWTSNALWSDYDSDGDLDVIISGGVNVDITNPSIGVATYHNYGNGSLIAGVYEAELRAATPGSYAGMLNSMQNSVTGFPDLLFYGGQACTPVLAISYRPPVVNGVN